MKANRIAPKLQDCPKEDQREWAVWYTVTDCFGLQDRDAAYFNNEKAARRYARDKREAELITLDGYGNWLLIEPL